MAMQCKKCGNNVNVLDRACGRCGASLGLLDSGPASRLQTDMLLDQATRMLDQEMAKEMQKQLRTGPVMGRRLVDLVDPDLPETFYITGAGDLAISPEEVYQMAAFVIMSPHVQSNLLYRQRAEATTLLYPHGNATVNAFATDHPLPDVEADPPLIVLFGGLTNAARLASLAMAGMVYGDGQGNRSLPAEVMQAMGREIVAQGGQLDRETASRIYLQTGLAGLGDDDELQRRARSYGAAMVITVIAHELGHIALGHTLATGEATEEISRNQEREADSFAASVATASPFSDYTVAGGIFWWMILTWVAAASGNPRATTHPHARERLMDFIRANQAQAEALGITADNIPEFLP